MSISIERIARILEWNEKEARRKLATERAASALQHAINRLRDNSTKPEYTYKTAMESIEDAEAWVAYLQDPTIIDGDTPTTPSEIERKFGKEPPA